MNITAANCSVMFFFIIKKKEGVKSPCILITTMEMRVNNFLFPKIEKILFLGNDFVFLFVKNIIFKIGKCVNFKISKKY